MNTKIFLLATILFTLVSCSSSEDEINEITKPSSDYITDSDFTIRYISFDRYYDQIEDDIVNYNLFYSIHYTDTSAKSYIHFNKNTSELSYTEGNITKIDKVISSSQGKLIFNRYGQLWTYDFTIKGEITVYSQQTNPYTLYKDYYKYQVIK